MDWTDAVQKGEPLAAGVSVGVVAMLLLTRRWWGRGGRRTRPDEGTPASDAGTERSCDGRTNRWFWPLLIAVVLFAGALRWNFAHSSLWWDEVWQARHASVGDWRHDKKHPGEQRFVPTSWGQAFWNYSKPANHPPMAVASKACHEVWRRLTKAPPGEFNEFVLRLPGFGASLLGVILIALMLRAWGQPGAGVIAAFFLAAHPWHLRFGIDGRGYTFLIPLTILAIGLLSRSVGVDPAFRRPGPTDGTPRGQAGGLVRDLAGWGFGLTQALILWCHPLSVWVCGGLAATGGWWIWRRHRGAARWRELARLVAVQLAGAMVFLQLFTPNLLQARAWGEKNQDGRHLDPPSFVHTISQVVCGREAALPKSGASRPDSPDERRAVAGPWAWLSGNICAALVLIGLAWGVSRSRARLGEPGAVLSILGLTCLGFVLVLYVASFYFYSRFIFAVLVPVAAWFGVAAVSLAPAGSRRNGRPAASHPLFRWGSRIAVAAVLGGWLIIVRPPLQRLQGISYAPLRETAAVLRMAADEGAAVFGYGFGGEALQYYLPSLPHYRGEDASDALAAALAAAQAARRPLLVAVGYEDLNRLKIPAGFALLDDPALFTEVFRRDGIEPQFAFRVLKSQP